MKVSIRMKFFQATPTSGTNETPPDAEELEWYVPAASLPAELQRSLNVINQFLETPLDLGGKKAKELLSKKTRRRRRTRRSPSPSDSDADSDDEAAPKKKREKKQKEKETYKSAQFIEDSEEEYGDMDAFLEKERQLRERTTAKAAAEGGMIGTMKATGTKKRRRPKGDKGAGSKKRRSQVKETADSEDSDIGVIGQLEDDDDEPVVAQNSRPRPRPRPRLRVKDLSNASSPLKNIDASVTRISPTGQLEEEDDDEPVVAQNLRPRPRPRPRPRVKNLSNVSSPLKDTDASVPRISPGVDTRPIVELGIGHP
jgi:replication fork protection complex subunit Tof1/Swi1